MENAVKQIEKKEYYYCPDTKKYVIFDNGFYSLEADGSLKLNRYYDAILIGDVWVEDVSEDEFKAEQLRLKNK